MKKLVIVLVAVIAFGFTTEAQKIYGKIGPSIVLIQTSETPQMIAFGGVKAELGFETFLDIRHGVYIGTYLHYNKAKSPSRQTTYDFGYAINYSPNINGYDRGYIGTGLMYRTSEHNNWENVANHVSDNEFNSWNIPLRVGVMFMYAEQTRVYLEGEYTVKVFGDKFQGFTFTVGVKF